MIRWVIACCLVLGLPAIGLAQAVKVTSGEHDGFTRLVLEFGRPVDWQVGRTSDGYEVQVPGVAPAYDLTGVYDIIGRTRLASVWADPVTGALKIGIGCACHAQPFEFRAGIVVIDLRDGPPPRGSSFEVALDGAVAPVLVDEATQQPRARPPAGLAADYDWIELQRTTGTATESLTSATSVPLAETPRLQTDPALDPLRSALLRQLSRGAAKGVIDMANPQADKLGPTGTESVNTRLGQIPGVQVGRGGEGASTMTADGGHCTSDADLDISTWGGDSPASAQMAEAMAGLVGEFDTPDADSVASAVRLHLFFGFGAEARQILTEIPTEQTHSAIWSSIGRIIDAEADPAPAFVGMAACDTAAALWAMLGDPAIGPGETVDRTAVLRSFSGLPVHLRRHLGPMLSERFLAIDDPSAADTVRAAILRAPGEAGPKVALMEAKLDLHSGKAAAAAARLGTLIDDSGPETPDALVELVESHVAQQKAMEPPQIIVLEGLLHERRGTVDEDRFVRALALARAVSGDFDGAFSELRNKPSVEAEVWRLLADVGSDSQVLTHAVLGQGAEPTASDREAATLAKRLSGLGFPDAAAAWLSNVADPDATLTARIELQERDARAALRLVAGSNDPATLTVRQEALQMLGDEPALAALFARSGQDDERWRAVARSANWEELAAAGPAPWQGLAQLLQVSEPPEVSGLESGSSGMLTRSKTLLQTSGETRLAIMDLLATIEAPSKDAR
ncbi:MAG: hypothetical protein ACRC14_07995 [Paracoccaceae bacterium]